MPNSAFLIDTNVLSELMKTEPDTRVMQWFARHSKATFYTSSITQAEIYTGIAFLPDGKRKHNFAIAAEALFSQEFADKILPFNSTASSDYAFIRAENKAAGHPVTTEDAMIAAIAKANKLPLLTRNIKDFVYCQGLKLVNPFFD